LTFRTSRLMTHQRADNLNTRGRTFAAVVLTLALVLLVPADALAAAEGEHEGILPTIARLFNFAILAGVLVYFLRAPIGEYLQTRSTQIRHDLVTAAEMRRTATAQLEQIQRQLASLPAEISALKARGAEDIAAEEARIAETAKGERERLVEQTRREIAMRLRVARRELTEHAAALAVQVAEQRIARTITPDDQLRLVDRYAAQLTQQGGSDSAVTAGGGGAR
jgi:F-type H+-transporting ATPase subunit b